MHEIVSSEVRKPIACSNCGTVAHASIQERLVGDRIEWSMELRCPACGEQLAIRDEGPLPSPYREAALSERGAFSLRPVGEAKSTSAWKALRGIQGFSVANARAKWDEIRTGRVCGTEVEMRYLARLLTEAGVDVEVIRSGAVADQRS
jgi:DNA-directed RNA polymerase subunit RPC12/RpoP